MWPDLRKGVLYTHPIFQLQGGITWLEVYLKLWKFVKRLCYHYTKLTVNFSFIAEPHMKLCLIKVAKSDACIRPLFANPVTYWRKQDDISGTAKTTSFKFSMQDIYNYICFELWEDDDICNLTIYSYIRLQELWTTCGPVVLYVNLTEMCCITFLVNTHTRSVLY